MVRDQINFCKFYASPINCKMDNALIVGNEGINFELGVEKIK
jgi:hypothetical protein